MRGGTMESGNVLFDVLLFVFRRRAGLSSDVEARAVNAELARNASSATKTSAPARDLSRRLRRREPSTVTSFVTHQRHCPPVRPPPQTQTSLYHHPLLLLPSMLHRFHSHYLGCETRHPVMDRGPGWTSFG